MGVLRSVLASPLVLRGAQIATGLVFLAAALGKLLDLSEFALQIHNYRIAPIWSENLIAMTLPWVELLAGLGLVLRVRPRSGAVVAFALMALFTVAVGAAWARGLDFECGCFGKASASRIGATKFLENAALTILAAIASRRPPR